MKTNDVCKWKAGQWWDKVKGMVSSNGGAVGVLFVYTQMDKMIGNKSLYQMPGKADFVVKPTSDTAATTKFAESLLKKIGGFIGTHTRPIERTSEVGLAIINIIRANLGKGDKERQERWQQVYPHYNSAKFFLIQETQANFTEFGDKERIADGMGQMLLDHDLMFNLGKLFVADAIIGNGDRLAKLNTGNIAFDNKTKNIILIDSEVILQDYQAACRGAQNDLGMYFDPGMVSRESQTYSPENFVKCGVVGTANGYKVPTAHQINHYVQNGKKHAPVLPASFGLDDLFCPQKWWNANFKGAIERRLGQLQLASPTAPVWEMGKDHFLQGVEKGMQEVDQVLFGRFKFNWLMTKCKFRQLLGKYGGGANYDWTTFKIRRLYYKIRRQTNDEEKAVAAAVKYANEKLAHLAV